MLFASCSQERGEEPSLTTTTVKTPVKVSLNIEADFDEESLRSLSASFSKDDNWKPKLNRPKKGEKVKLHLVFSDGNKVTHAKNTVFTVVDENGKLSYSGEIEVDGYSRTKAWYVTAIYGGALDGDNYAYTPAMYELGDEAREFEIGTVDGGLDLPYMSGWTRIKPDISAEGNKEIEVFQVKLKPQGYLLRLKFKNKRDHSLSIKRILSGNDDVFLNANFTVSTALSDLQSGAYPTASGRGNEGQGRYFNSNLGIELKRGEVTPTESKTYLIWVMPKGKLTASKEFTLRAVHYKQGAEWYFPFNITLQPGGSDGVGGISSLKTLTFPNDHKPYRTLYDIDFVGKGNMKPDGTEAPEGAVGYENTWSHYNNNLRKNANIRKYGTDMTPSNWAMLLPKSGTQSGGLYDAGGETDGWEFFSNKPGSLVEGKVGSNFSLGEGGEANVLKNYRRAQIGTNRILYAVRTNFTSQFLGKTAAFRYQLEDNGTLTIEMVHLQTENTNIKKTIDDVADEGYWATARQYGEVVKRIFPGGTGIQLSPPKHVSTSTSYYYVGVNNDTLAGTIWNYGRVGGAGRVNYGLALGAQSEYSFTARRKVRLMKEEVQLLHENP